MKMSVIVCRRLLSTVEGDVEVSICAPVQVAEYEWRCDVLINDGRGVNKTSARGADSVQSLINCLRAIRGFLQDDSRLFTHKDHGGYHGFPYIPPERDEEFDRALQKASEEIQRKSLKKEPQSVKNRGQTAG